jgi:hypothetical protein
VFEIYRLNIPYPRRQSGYKTGETPSLASPASFPKDSKDSKFEAKFE